MFRTYHTETDSTSPPQPVSPEPGGNPIHAAPAAVGRESVEGELHAGGPTVIGDDITIVGRFRSKGEVILDGTIEADVRCASMVVRENGKLTGRIVADAVTIYGTVEGAIYGNSVELFSMSNVKGDIFHRGIGIERGTRYGGTVKFLDDPIALGDSALNDLRSGRSR